MAVSFNLDRIANALLGAMGDVPFAAEGVRELLRALREVERLSRLTVGGNLQAIDSATGIHIIGTVDRPIPIRIDATDGAGTYAWTEMIEDVNGGWIERPNGQIGTLSSLSAYERDGEKDVPVGAIVLAWKGYLRSNADREWIFDYCCHEPPVPVQVTSAGAPTTTLNGVVSGTATSLVVNSASAFPGRNNFLIKINDEVLQVTAGAGTTTWTITRAQSGTQLTDHSNGATVTLVGGYAWTEQDISIFGNWTNKAGGRTGSFVAEPAFERNLNLNVPNNTYALIWRRTKLGAGSSTLSSGITATATSVPIANRSSFPQITPFYIWIQGEVMKVTAGAGSGAGTFTVVRAQYHDLPKAPMPHDSGMAVYEVVAEWVFDYCCGPGLTVQDTKNCTVAITAIDEVATTVTVNSAAEFPAVGSFDIKIDSEQMTVTAGAGTTSWTVTRAVAGTTAAKHNQYSRACRVIPAITNTLNGGITSTALSLTVNSAALFPTVDRFVILIDSEQMLVTGVAGTLFVVLRGYNGTTPASHSNGATVGLVLPDVVPATVTKIIFDDTAFVQPGGPGPNVAIHHEVAQVVRLVSGPDASGFYDAFLQKWDPVAEKWLDDIAIWVVDLNP